MSCLKFRQISHLPQPVRIFVRHVRLEVWKAKNFKVSVLFHGAVVETCVELFSRCQLVCQSVPYAMSLLVLLSQETPAFHFRKGRSSVFNSVKVVLVVSLSLHQQQCDNFHNIQKESTKCAATVIFTQRFFPFCPLGPTRNVCTKLL